MCSCGFYLLLQVTEVYKNRATPLQILKSRMLEETERHSAMCECSNNLQFWVDMNDLNKARPLQCGTQVCDWQSFLVSDYFGTRFAFCGELAHASTWVPKEKYFHGLPDTSSEPLLGNGQRHIGFVCEYNSYEHWYELYSMLKKGWLDSNKYLLKSKPPQLHHLSCHCYQTRCLKCSPLTAADPPPGYKIIDHGIVVKCDSDCS